MFSENRSELAIPVVGFLLLGFATLFAAVSIFNAKWDFFENIGVVDPKAFLALGMLLAVVAFFAFAKAYMIEGTAFGMFAVFLGVYYVAGTAGIYQLAVLALALAVVAVILAIMAYRVGDLMMVIMAILSLVVFVPVMFAKNVDSGAFAVAGIGFLAVAVVALISAVLEWLFVQDVAMDYADYMYGDDDEECGCGCESEE